MIHITLHCSYGGAAARNGVALQLASWEHCKLTSWQCCKHATLQHACVMATMLLCSDGKRHYVALIVMMGVAAKNFVFFTRQL